MVDTAKVTQKAEVNLGKKAETTKKEGNKYVGLQGLPMIGSQPKNSKEEAYFREMVEYEFFNLEDPGLMHSFSYGCKGNDHNFKLLHGGKYVLPRFIANWLESRSKPIWKWRPDGTGLMQKQLVGREPRFRLSLVF